MFISFEGIEGSGKTTQIRLLCDALKQSGKDVVMSKEPGGTAFGSVIRSLLLDPNQTFNHSHTELMLFYADRLEHVSGVIRPALDRGAVAVVDRYMDSTYAYQCFGRGVSKEIVTTLNTLVGVIPDITILCDLSVEEGLKRAKARAGLDRFEQETVDFHDRVRAGFLEKATQEPNRIRVVSVAQRSIEDIHEEIMQIIKEKLR